MCYKEKNPYMVGLSQESGNILATMTEKTSMVKELTDVMLKTLNPHNPVIAAIVAMTEQVDKNEFGVLQDFNLVRLPLSLIGADKVRYRTPVVEMLHESILSFNMSDITKNNVTKVLNKHGYCMMFLCSCGVVIGKCEDVKSFYGSEHHIEMDKLRSAIDAEGNPVELVASLEDIPVQTMDLSTNGAERNLFKRIREMLETMSICVNPPSYQLEEKLKSFVDKASSQTLHDKSFLGYVPKYKMV